VATRDRVLSPLAPAGRFSRRCFALACGAGIVGFPIAANLGAGANRAGTTALLEPWTVPIAVLVFGTLTGLQFSFGNAASKPPRTLDEREHVLRDRAYQSAYRTLLVVIQVGGLLAMTQTGAGDPLPTGRGAFAIAFSFITLTAALPTLAMAWVAPGSPDHTSVEERRERIRAALLAGLTGLTFLVFLLLDLGHGAVAVLLAATFVLALAATWGASRRSL